MKLFGSQLFFYGRGDILSNMYPVDIKIDGFTYPSSEHVYVLMKCLSANDLKTVDKVRREPNPFEVKKIGYGVQGLDPQYWDEINFDVMVGILLLKFQQPKFKQLIIKTEGLTLIEASPSLIWGCGVHINEIESELTHFTGRNKCGEAMMIARELITTGTTIIPETLIELL